MPNSARKIINSIEQVELAANPDKRKALAKVIMRVLDSWDLDTSEQLILLGLSSQSRAQLTKYRNGTTPISSNQDALQRVGLLLSIYQLLKSLYPNNEPIKQKWIHMRNKKLNNYTPLDIMLKGIPEIKKIKALLEFQMVR